MNRKFDIYTRDFAGTELTVYPHWARYQQKRDVYGHRPVTTGGIVIGYFGITKTGGFEGFDINHEPLNIRTSKLADCAELIATRDDALTAYRQAAYDGAFGMEAERAERERADEVIANLDDTTELIEVEVPEVNHNDLDALRVKRGVRGSSFATTTVLFDGEQFIGTLVRKPSGYTDTPVWAAHDRAGRRTQGMAYSEAKQVLLNAHRASQSPCEGCGVDNCEHVEDSYAWRDVCHEPVNNQGGECGAPLAADGTCPGLRGHAAEMHRRDRDRHLDDARHYLLKAIEEHEALRKLAPGLRQGRRDYAGEVIENLYDQVRNLSDHLDGLSV